MVKVYAVVLAVGMVGLVVLLMGDALAENVDRPDKAPSSRLGPRAALVIGGAVGFGMAGLSAEFAPVDIAWPLTLLMALAAAGLSVLWVRYALSRSEAG